jgi:hypothetical protein
MPDAMVAVDLNERRRLFALPKASDAVRRYVAEKEAAA